MQVHITVNAVKLSRRRGKPNVLCMGSRSPISTSLLRYTTKYAECHFPLVKKLLPEATPCFYYAFHRGTALTKGQLLWRFWSHNLFSSPVRQSGLKLLIMSMLQACLSKEELVLIIQCLPSDSAATRDVVLRLEGLLNTASNFAVIVIDDVSAFVVAPIDAR